MRTYDYSKSWQALLTPEIVAMLTKIHEYKGEQALFIEAKKDILSYTGDKIEFEKFLLSMTADYLNSDTLPEYMEWDFSDMVEDLPKSA